MNDDFIRSRAIELNDQNIEMDPDQINQMDPDVYIGDDTDDDDNTEKNKYKADEN